jgi:hypothetical protein
VKKATIALSILMVISFAYGCATPVAELKPVMPANDVYANLEPIRK